MKPVRGLAVLVSFVFFLSLSAMAGAPEKSQGVQRLENDTGGKAKIRVDNDTGHAEFVTIPGNSMRSSSINNKAMKANQRAKQFFREYGDAFGVEDADSELQETRSTRSLSGGEQTVLAQTYEGIPVFGGELRAHFDRSGDLAAVNGKFVAGLKVNTTPSVARGTAEARAVRTVLLQEVTKKRASRSADDLTSSFDEKDVGELMARSSDLVIFREGLARGAPGADHLAYKVEVVNSIGTVREFVFIDAHSSKIIDQITGIYDALNRRAFDAEGAAAPGPNYPGTPFWVEGDPLPTTDVEADNMIYASAETYDMFFNGFGRDSFDDLGATMDAIFNRGNGCPNASWNGLFISFCPGLTTDDITGHEWGHAYTEYTNNLIYQWQPGALNESYSDIWGEIVDQINGRGVDAPAGLRTDGSCSVYQTGNGDDSLRWLMGEEYGALRDMWTPSCGGDPDNVSDELYWCSTGDSGGVHFNSGVPNHAFTLMVDGGSFNGETIAGIGLTKAAHIQWAAQNMLTPASNFVDNADALEAACSALVGADLNDLSTGAVSGEVIGPADCAEVGKAISAVEMRLEPTQCEFEPLLDPAAPALCENLGNTQSIYSEDFESGSLPAGWIVGSYDVANPATFDTPDWDVTSSIPGGSSGLYAAFGANPILGDCGADTEAGVIFLESPDIALPAMRVPHVAFDHYVATEAGWDGGNLKVSVNGGPWTVVPASDYSFNTYNPVLNGSDNPMGGQEAFTGANEGSVGGSWGQSQVNLFGLALPGDTVKLRFDVGMDGCNGLDGWYVDSLEVYSCSAEPLPVCGDGQMEPGEMCDDGNTNDGDGCSASCSVEDNWYCSASTPPSSGGNILADWSFEGGVPNADWDASSTFGGVAGFPLCGPGNGCPAASLANTGSWLVWVGGLSGGVTSSVTQDLVIPSSATEVSLLVWRGLCDDTGDTLYVRVDGNEIGSIACTAVDGGYAEYTFPLAPYNDDATHDLYIGGTVGGTNGTHSNFFADDVFIEGNLSVPAKPSECARIIQDLSCNVDAVGFYDGVPTSWTVVDNEGTGVVWTDLTTAFTGVGSGSAPPGNFTGGTDDAASVSSDANFSTEYDTELRSNSIDLSNANSASVNYLVDFQVFSGTEFLNLDISTDGGNSWTNLLSWNEDHPVGGLFAPIGESVSVDLAAYLGESDVQLRWHYFNPAEFDWDWYAQVDDVAVMCDINGTMSGLGFVNQDGTKYNHTFELQCADGATANSMEIQWGKGKGKHTFSLGGLTSAVCSAQPGTNAGTPTNAFNTIVGEGVGSLDGAPATIEFRISDAGEPGRNDEMHYTITGDDGVSVSGKLDGGNTQALP